MGETIYPVPEQWASGALVNAAQHNSLHQHFDLERESMLASGQTEDGKEGIRAFIEKRPAKFQ